MGREAEAERVIGGLWPRPPANQGYDSVLDSLVDQWATFGRSPGGRP